MVTPIPPCPMCSGRMRPTSGYDLVVCSCGFRVAVVVLQETCELEPEARASTIRDKGCVVRETGPCRPGCESCRAGIRVSDRYVELDTHCNNRRYAPVSIPDLHDVAVEAGARCGLEHIGARSSLEDRRVLYAVAPVGQESDAAREMVKRIADENGPGRWWSMRGAVHVIVNEGDAHMADIEDIPHVFLRAVYFHEGSAP